jgi:hypothetical protein
MKRGGILMLQTNKRDTIKIFENSSPFSATSPVTLFSVYVFHAPESRPLFLVVKDPQSAPTEDFFHKPSHAFIHNQPRSV